MGDCRARLGDGVIEASVHEAEQLQRIPGASLHVGGVEGKRPPQRHLGLAPVPVVEQLHASQRSVSLSELRVDRQRVRRLVPGSRHQIV